MVMKLDLAKAYDKVSWLYLKLMLIHIEMRIQIVNWILGCLSIASFAILLNGSASRIFFPTAGLR